MDLVDLLKMKGEWVGRGSMTIGNQTGDIEEYIKVEGTDKEWALSYIRKSLITFPGRSVLHNEIGYMRTENMGLLLSSGSFEILDWITANNQYEQVNGSPDSRNMTRKVTFPVANAMKWENAMEVDHRGNWVSHTTETTFTKVA